MVVAALIFWIFVMQNYGDVHSSLMRPLQHPLLWRWGKKIHKAAAGLRRFTTRYQGEEDSPVPHLSPLMSCRGQAGELRAQDK